MNKKELIEELKNKMPTFTGTDEEIEIKTALYLYVEVAKLKEFDEKYYWGNQKARDIAYKQSIEDSKNIEQITKKRKITCVTISTLYKYVLQEFGINNQVIKEIPEDPHVNNIIHLKNGKKIRADIQMDMHNIQTKMRIENFNYLKEEKMPNRVLDEMLKEIGYVEKETDYKNDKIKSAKQQIYGENIPEILKQIIKNEDISEGIENAGIIEAYRYYKSVFKILLPEHIGEDVFQFQVKSPKKESDEYQYSFCIYGLDRKTKETKIFLYSEKNRQMLECDTDTLNKMQKNGLILGRTEKEAGVKILKRVIAKQQKNRKTNADQEK